MLGQPDLGIVPEQFRSYQQANWLNSVRINDLHFAILFKDLGDVFVCDIVHSRMIIVPPLMDGQNSRCEMPEGLG